METETYRTREGTIGTFFYTKCGNRMYSIRDELAYDGKICPKCHKTLKFEEVVDNCCEMLDDDWSNA